ncbi:MAG: hypothetical protein GWP08_18680 [Nitrospiraceae bacterium]|nr:hypothetical protein [Nitrospiraceae bacterium]
MLSLLRYSHGALCYAYPEARAYTIGAPYGNMRLDWRTWCQERLVDGLVLDVFSGTWLYPAIRKRPGYVQCQQENVLPV